MSPLPDDLEQGFLVQGPQVLAGGWVLEGVWALCVWLVLSRAGVLCGFLVHIHHGSFSRGNWEKRVIFVTKVR